MDKNYVYIRDENGNIIGRTYGSGNMGDQYVSSDGEKKTASGPIPGPEIKDRRFPALDLLRGWLAGDVRDAFLDCGRQGAWTGIAAPVLALILALGLLLSALTSNILSLLPSLIWSLVLLGLGAGLLLRKRTLTASLFLAYSVLDVLSMVLSVLQLTGIPGIGVLLFFTILRFLLDTGAYLSLAWLTKNCHTLGRGARIWLLPAALEALRFLLSPALFPLLSVAFAATAAHWLLCCYQTR